RSAQARASVSAGRRRAPGTRRPAGARPLRTAGPPDPLLDAGDGAPAGATDRRADHALLGPLAHLVGRLAGRAADLRRLGRAPGIISLRAGRCPCDGRLLRDRHVRCGAGARYAGGLPARDGPRGAVVRPLLLAAGPSALLACV